MPYIRPRGLLSHPALSSCVVAPPLCVVRGMELYTGLEDIQTDRPSETSPCFHEERPVFAVVVVDLLASRIRRRAAILPAASFSSTPSADDCGIERGSRWAEHLRRGKCQTRLGFQPSCGVVFSSNRSRRRLPLFSPPSTQAGRDREPLLRRFPCDRSVLGRSGGFR